jgi:prepilin-type N-terminal cleavage/methylation domain-containing protein
MRRHEGFTLVELMIAVAIIGITTAMALPRIQSFLTDQRLKAAARGVGDAFTLARMEATRTGNVHIVFFMEERPGTPLVDLAGTTVPILILDDGPSGSAGQNCSIDGGETFRTIPAENGVSWGATYAAARAPGDTEAGPIGDGIALVDSGGNAVTWVAFRADGIPISATSACALGGTGTGGGAIYLTNGVRDYAIVLSTLGGVRLHAYERDAAAWRN